MLWHMTHSTHGCQVQGYISPKLVVAYSVSEHLMRTLVTKVCQRLRPQNPFYGILDDRKSPVIAWQGDMHWQSVAMCSTTRTVWVHDPMGGYNQGMWSHIVECFGKLGWEVQEVTSCHAGMALQNDGYNCGIWAAFFAGVWAQWLSKVRRMSCLV